MKFANQNTQSIMYKSYGIPILIFILFFSACQKPQKENKEREKTNNFNDTILLKTENPKLTEYRLFVHQLDNVDVNSVQLAVEKFKTTFYGQQTSLCDSGFVVFQQMMDSIETYQNIKLQNDTTDYEYYFEINNFPPKVLKYKELLAINGFKLSKSDEIVFVEQDRSYPINLLSSMLSEPMKLYLSEIEIENREGFSENAAIIISWKQHVDRIIWYEDFTKANPTFVFLENCRNYKKAYFTYLLTGFENTKLFIQSNQMELSSYYANAYRYLLQSYPDSETAQLTTPYLETIEQKSTDARRELLKKYVIKGLIFNL